MAAVTLSSVTGQAGLSWGASLLAAGLATLARPATWALALAAFLVRGGIVVLVLPIVVLPTTTGLANELAPLLTSLYLGRTTVEVVSLVVAAAAALTAVVLFAMLVGTWLDGALVADAAQDEELGRLRRDVRTMRVLLARGLAVRLLAFVPLGIAVAWGAGRIVDAGYAELTLPDDLSLPLALRVLARVPDAVVVVGAAWVVGEVLGGLALRHLILDGATVSRALRAALVTLIRQPIAGIATTIVTDVALAGTAALGVAGSVIATDRVRVAISHGDAIPEVVAGLLLLAGVWVASLVVIGVMTAFRNIAWTFEVVRRGTIGEPVGIPTGDWAAAESSGTL
jgi:hypothetical protein